VFVSVRLGEAADIPKIAYLSQPFVALHFTLATHLHHSDWKLVSCFKFTQCFSALSYRARAVTAGVTLISWRFGYIYQSALATINTLIIFGTFSPFTTTTTSLLDLWCARHAD